MGFVVLAAVALGAWGLLRVLMATNQSWAASWRWSETASHEAARRAA
jgi:hypothetical protein